MAKGMTLAEALEGAFTTFDFRVLDKMDFPPGKIAHFAKDANLVRNVAVLRTGLHSLYAEIKNLESGLPRGPHSVHDFDVNGNLCAARGQVRLVQREHAQSHGGR